MAFNLLRRLCSYDDLDISVILLNGGKLADGLVDRGIPVHVINEHQYSFPKIAGQIRNMAAQDPPHLIHSHRYKENFLAFLASRFRDGIKLVSTQHGLPEFHGKTASVNARIISSVNFLVLSRNFTTVAVSADIHNALVSRFGFRKEGVEIIHNGINLPDSRLSPPERGNFVIGSSGRLFPVKDYPLMVDIATAVVSGNHGNVRFELAGDGPERQSLETRAAHLGVKDRFDFKGHVDDMDSFYQGLDLYINTSLHEGIPMTILEAMGHGLPIIAPAVGGITEIIEDGKEGFLIDTRNPQDFAEKCLLLKNDRELWERMSRAALEKAERCFSAEIMAEKYYRLYKRITG
ncbi:MAG: glycosyltransferase family 4 protein [Geobacteraceae bacterium]|nr:glycosyltransferase family 4 protein [Geobacteraceae bacterium]